MKLAILMDSLENIKPYKDTTVGMIKCAQELGWSCVYFTPKDLYCEDGRAFARANSIEITSMAGSMDSQEKSRDNQHQQHWAKTHDLGELPLSTFDIILMRKDPPFDLEYIIATYALDLAEKEGVFVSNKPQSLRDANEKFFTLNFPQCCPTTLVTKDIRKLRAFWELHKNVIYKPLEGMGGKAIFQVDEKGLNLSVILEMLTQNQTVTIMAQRYIPEISTLGDKRIILINGTPCPYALARIPAKGELRGNLAAGAKGIVVPITQRDTWIAQQIAPTLKAMGLYFVGIDVIGDYLTEINVTSPTCMREISEESGIDIAKNYLLSLETMVNK